MLQEEIKAVNHFPAQGALVSARVWTRIMERPADRKSRLKDGAAQATHGGSRTDMQGFYHVPEFVWLRTAPPRSSGGSSPGHRTGEKPVPDRDQMTAGWSRS